VAIWCAIAPCATALAEPAVSPAQLVYEVGDRADECPDEAALRREVAQRLGADPFTADADAIVRVTIDRTDAGYAATVIVISDGDAVGSRDLHTSRSCAVLGRAVALAVTLVLPALQDEPFPRSPKPDAELALPPMPVGRVEAVVTPAPPMTRTTEIGATVCGHVGLLPGAGDAVSLEARLRWSRWSFGAELGWNPPAAAPIAGGEIRASLLSGGFSPCWHGPRFGLCAVGAFGVLRSEGVDFSTTSTATTPYAAAGARVIWEVELTDHVAARARLDANATLLRARLHATGSPAGDWSAPPASAAAGISIVGRFP
jgi:hypothetical protein